MNHDAVITVDEYENAREKSGDQWSDFEVFSEERDRAPLREIVLEVVEGQYTHPSGPDSVYGMRGSAGELVRDKVFSSDLVPEGIPSSVREKFADKLSEEVQDYSEELYKAVRDEVDPEGDATLSEVREVMEPKAEELVPEEF